MRRELGMFGACLVRSATVDDDEVSLLIEVAGDLGLALFGIETERRQQAYAQIVASSQEAMALMDRGYVFLEANSSYARLVGRGDSEIAGHHAAEIMGEELFLRVVKPNMDRCFAGESVDFETSREAPGGELRSLEASCSPCRNQDGSISTAAVCIRDVTERNRAEATIREREQRLRSIMDSMIEGCQLIGNDWRYLYINAAAEVHNRRPNVELLGNKYMDMWPGIEATEVFDTIRRCLHDRIADHMESEFSFPDGKKGSFDLRIEPVPEGVLVLSVDITERKRAAEAKEKLEDQLRQAQKMESIGSLAGGVAHDFNNLLSVILSYTEFATQGANEQLRDDLQEVKKAAERAAALTRQLLAFSRKQILQPVPLDLNHVATALEKMLRRILGEDIDLVQKLAPDLGLTLADPSQIDQIIMNLVVNARDAMPEGGKLTIETANAKLDEDYASRHVAVKPGPYVLLAVTDTGCGMDERTQARLFEPFFTTKEKGKGTGLGLSTVYGIVKQTGGNIWVYSEPGKGTTFKIFLPCSPTAKAAGPRVPALVTRTTGTETILVIEDEEGVRNAASRILRAAGYTVLTAATGDEALLTADAHRGEIHLVLTDIVMPGMSGKIVAERLAQSRPRTRVLYMSGYTGNAIAHHGVLEPGTHFIGKPFGAEDLTRKAREVLDDARSAGPSSTTNTGRPKN